MRLARGLRLVVVVVLLVVACSGCAVVKLTVMQGPGCCEDGGEVAEPAGAQHHESVVHVSVVEQAPQAVLVPQGNGAVVVESPPADDVRLSCQQFERPEAEKVTATSYEYLPTERLLLGFMAVAEGTIATVLGGAALDARDRDVTSRAFAGVAGVGLGIDALVTAGLAVFHPTVEWKHVYERPGTWRPQSSGCPKDLAVVVNGVDLPIGPQAHLMPLDAARVARALQRGGQVGLRVDGVERPARFFVQAGPSGWSANSDVEVPLARQ